MATDFLGAAVSLFGGVLIPVALYAGQKSVAKSQATMELLKEFNGLEFATARGAARRLILAHPSKSYTELEQCCSGLQKPSDAESLYLIVRFFHRLNALRETGMLRDSKLLPLFGPVFGYWWKFSFEPQLLVSEGWRVGEDIANLKRFMDRRAVVEHRQEFWQSALEDGEKERAAVLGPS